MFLALRSPRREVLPQLHGEKKFLEVLAMEDHGGVLTLIALWWPVADLKLNAGFQDLLSRVYVEITLRSVCRSSG